MSTFLRFKPHTGHLPENRQATSSRWESLQPDLSIQLLHQAALAEAGVRAPLSSHSAGPLCMTESLKGTVLCFLTAHGTSPFTLSAHTAGVHMPGIQSLRSQAITYPPLLVPHSSGQWTLGPPLLYRMDTAHCGQVQPEETKVKHHSPQETKEARSHPKRMGQKWPFCVSR